MAGRGTRDWDAATYDRVSTPQQDWARPVVERLQGLFADHVAADVAGRTAP